MLDTAKVESVCTSFRKWDLAASSKFALTSIALGRHLCGATYRRSPSVGRLTVRLSFCDLPADACRNRVGIPDLDQGANLVLLADAPSLSSYIDCNCSVVSRRKDMSLSITEFPADGHRVIVVVRLL